MRAVLIFAESNAGAAASHPDHNFINHIRARMWKRNAVFDHTWVCLLTRQHLFEKSFGFGDFPAADLGVLSETEAEAVSAGGVIFPSP